MFCITFLSRCGMERASSLRLASGMFRQACHNLEFSSPIVLGIGSLYAASSMMLHRFSMGLRSGEFAGHSSFWIKSLAPLLCCFRLMSWCAILNKGRTAIVREKLSFYRLFCCRSSAEKRLHFFLKPDFCDIILCRYSLSLRDEM